MRLRNNKSEAAPAGGVRKGFFAGGLVVARVLGDTLFPIDVDAAPVLSLVTSVECNTTNNTANVRAINERQTALTVVATALKGTVVVDSVEYTFSQAGERGDSRLRTYTAGTLDRVEYVEPGTNSKSVQPVSCESSVPTTTTAPTTTLAPPTTATTGVPPTTKAPAATTSTSSTTLPRATTTTTSPNSAALNNSPLTGSIADRLMTAGPGTLERTG